MTTPSISPSTSPSIRFGIFTNPVSFNTPFNIPVIINNIGNDLNNKYLLSLTLNEFPIIAGSTTSSPSNTWDLDIPSVITRIGMSAIPIPNNNTFIFTVCNDKLTILNYTYAIIAQIVIIPDLSGFGPNNLPPQPEPSFLRASINITYTLTPSSTPSISCNIRKSEKLKRDPLLYDVLLKSQRQITQGRPSSTETSKIIPKNKCKPIPGTMITISTTLGELFPQKNPSDPNPGDVYNNLFDKTSSLKQTLSDNNYPINLSGVAMMIAHGILKQYNVSSSRICNAQFIPSFTSYPTSASKVIIIFVITDNTTQPLKLNDDLSHICIGNWILYDYSSSSSPSIIGGANVAGNRPSIITMNPTCTIRSPNTIVNMNFTVYITGIPDASVGNQISKTRMMTCPQISGELININGTLAEIIGDKNPVQTFIDIMNGQSPLYQILSDNELPNNLDGISMLFARNIVQTYNVSIDRVCNAKLNFDKISNPTANTMVQLSFILTDNIPTEVQKNDYLSSKCIRDWIMYDFNNASPLDNIYTVQNSTLPSGLQTRACSIYNSSISGFSSDTISKEDFSATSTSLADSSINTNPSATKGFDIPSNDKRSSDISPDDIPPYRNSSETLTNNTSNNTMWIVLGVGAVLFVIIGTVLYRNKHQIYNNSESDSSESYSTPYGNNNYDSSDENNNTFDENNNSFDESNNYSGRIYSYRY
jgi:hypothetical protein